MSDIFAILSIVIGLIASIWQIFDPQNGLFRYLAPPNNTNKAYPTLSYLIRNLLLLIISYSILAVAIFLTSSFFNRNFSISESNYFPSNIFDYSAALNYYHASVYNQLTEKLNDGKSTLLNMHYSTTKLWVCFIFFNILNGFYIKNEEAYLVGLAKGVLIFLFLFFVMILVSLFGWLVMVVLDLFVKIDIHYYCAIKTFIFYSTFFILPLIMYLNKTSRS